MTLQSLVANKLTCLRGGRLVFRNIDFSVGSGQTLALEGANGAGKSSLLRMIAGFLSPAAGAITLRVADSDITEDEDRGKYIGWLGHLDAAKPQMTVRETLHFFAAFYRSAAADDAVAQALVAVGLARLSDLPCQYLSAGQKKRLALARLKISGRPLWLMDEPLAALDADGKRLAAQAIALHCAAGGMAIVATHEPLGIASDKLVLGA